MTKDPVQHEARVAQFLSTSADYLGLFSTVAADDRAERLPPGLTKRAVAPRPWVGSTATLVPAARCAD